MPKPICQALFEGSPYQDADLTGVRVDMHGWNSDAPIFEAVLRALRPSLVIEVGTWKGASAIHMAGLMQGLGIDGEIVCVDTWLGPPPAWTQKRQMLRTMRLRNGYPQLYYTFLANVIHAGFTDMITPLPAASEGGYYVLRDLGVTADFIYVDAGHQYESVSRDLRIYLELLSPDGVLLADDFSGWPDVNRAVRETAASHGLFGMQVEGKALLSRRDLSALAGAPAPKAWTHVPKQVSALSRLLGGRRQDPARG